MVDPLFLGGELDMVSRLETSRHKSQDSCWVIVHGFVYDVTDFLGAHPGGKEVILKHAGGDATRIFDSFHSSDTIDKYLKPEQKLGPATGPEPPSKNDPPLEKPKEARLGQISLRNIINIPDFEVAASKVLSPKAFAFFKAGADAEITSRWNQKAWQAIRFRPRVLEPITKIDTSTAILNNHFSAPFFIGPAGGGKLAHGSGEILLTKAAAKHGILHWVCNNAGCTQQEMADARSPGQVLYWQIYAMRDLTVTEKEIRQAVASGYRGFCLTVDAIHVGKRERDMRLVISESDSSGVQDEDDGLSGGVSVNRPAVYADFTWTSAIEWLRSITDLPIAIKGIQCWEDAALCMHYGVHPWLSNHGGRQLEGAPAAAETLVEIRQHCPAVFERCEVIVDGGITRGSDIVKALALGAKGVALGRGFLFPLVFGEVGVSRAIRILKQEVEVAMALLGVSSIDQIKPSHVDFSSLAYAGAVARAHL
ncbi:oxidoreductase [Penicillium hispanicum]|uniref:oxidoreductase n=1 Tax=Penicillium hispanicum TaxID=1080232 RepID=UPI00253FDC6C|nr:oxidoreductase [Penicillium hispanicum]KAJ5580010.1 oxidoreductase [Penicillium hispanicum]